LGGDPNPIEPSNRYCIDGCSRVYCLNINIQWHSWDSSLKGIYKLIAKK